jgi:protein-disulfide isomerase
MKKSALAALLTASSVYGAGFQWNGKSYEEKDLPSFARQGLYDIQKMGYTQTQKLLDQAVLDIYLTQESEKTKKPKDVLEKELLKAPTVSEAEAKTWFEQNKHRIPPGRDFESLKGDIMGYLGQEAQGKARDVLITKIKKEKNFELKGLQDPVAPVFAIAQEGHPQKGAAQPKTTLVEFADYTCGHCKKASESLGQVLNQFKDSLRLTYIHFPLNSQEGSLPMVLAQGGVCAEAQGKFWEYHEKAFAAQGSQTLETPMAIAKELKLNETQYGACMKDKATTAKVLMGRAKGEAIGVQATPSIYLDGQKTESYEAQELMKVIQKKVS